MPGLALFLKQPFLFAWLVKCTLILWLFVVADRAHQVLLSSLHILAAYIGRLHDAAVFENAAYCTAPRQLTRRHSPLPAKIELKSASGLALPVITRQQIHGE